MGRLPIRNRATARRGNRATLGLLLWNQASAWLQGLFSKAGGQLGDFGVALVVLLAASWPPGLLLSIRDPVYILISVPVPTAFAYISTNTVKLWAILGLVGMVVVEYGLL
jgi:hypothetical protein